MGNDIYWLITLYYDYNNSLIRCAMKTTRDELIDAGCSDDVEECYLEPENRTLIHQLLPAHVRSCGPIVEITSLFCVS